MLFLFVVATIPQTVQANEIARPATDNEGVHHKPEISGDRMVWWDNSSGNFDIYMYDLSDMQEYRITNNPGKQETPDISGDIIVWTDHRHGSGSTEIYMYDLSVDTNGDGTPNYMETEYTGGRPDPDPAESRITDNINNEQSPAVDGAMIVWVDSKDMSIRGYDLLAGKEFTLSEKGTRYSDCLVQPDYVTNVNPRIDGHRVIWTKQKTVYSWDGKIGLCMPGTASFDIHLYNFSVDSDADGVSNYLDEDTSVSADSARAMVLSPKLPGADIYGDTIVYRDSGEDDDVFVYDIPTGATYNITAHPAKQISPAIQGNSVVYEDTRETSPEIYMYDLEHGVEHRITSDAIQQRTPKICGDLIVYEEVGGTVGRIGVMRVPGVAAPVFNLTEPASAVTLSEGETVNLHAKIDNPAGGLTLEWYLDHELVAGQTADTYPYTPGYKSAGGHIIRLDASNSNYTVSWYWRVTVTDQALPTITDVYPTTDSLVVEGATQNFRINISVPDGLEGTTSWYLNGEKVADDTHSYALSPSEVGSTHSIVNTITAKLDSGDKSTSHTWYVGVRFLADTDGDGYTDTQEDGWGSDPLDPSSAPLDSDADGIPDFVDADDDGDGVPDSQDAAPLDSSKQATVADGTMTVLILEIVAISMVAIFILLLGRKK